MDDDDFDDACYDPIEEGDEELCRALWLAVILQALLDARGKYGNSVEQRKAQIWFEGRGGIQSDFAAVCKLAGVNFEKTRTRCLALLEPGSDLLDFRTMKRDREHNRTVKNRKRYNRRTERNAIARAARRIVLRASNENASAACNDNFPIKPLKRRPTKINGEKK